jgi:hypothetical protein
MFPDAEVKMEEDTDEDYNVGSIKPTIKHKQKSTNKKGAKDKKQGNKSASVSKYPRRNSTRAANKFKLKY